MGLFSKFFSRENETPGAAQDEGAPAAPSDAAADVEQNEPVTELYQRAAVMQKDVPLPKETAAVQPTPVAAPEAAVSPAPPATPVAVQATAAAPAIPVALPTAAAAAPATPAATPPATPQKAAARPKPAVAATAKAAAPKVNGTAVKPEPAGVGAPAKAAVTQVAPARKTAPQARPASEASAKPKRTPRPTPRMFPALEVPSPPDGADPRPLEADVDAAVDRLLDATPSRATAATARDEAADRRAVIETFTGMAELHAQPLRELLFQMSLGGTPRQWAAACRPVLLPVMQASKQIGLAETAGLLEALDAALERAEREPSACIGEAAARALEQAYARLHEHMPGAFAAAAATDNRRMILLESLLLQVPALERRTLAKLYAAGLTSLPQLSSANAEELSAVAGIDRELARAVVEHVQRFERERARVDPLALRSHVHGRLRAVVARLQQLQAEFERAEQDESNDRKRAARRSREVAVRELDLLFAEVGDVGLIEELKRCPVHGKIRRVESYLERLQASA